MFYALCFVELLLVLLCFCCCFTFRFFGLLGLVLLTLFGCLGISLFGFPLRLFGCSLLGCLLVNSVVFMIYSFLLCLL